MYHRGNLTGLIPNPNLFSSAWTGVKLGRMDVLKTNDRALFVLTSSSALVQ